MSEPWRFYAFGNTDDEGVFTATHVVVDDRIPEKGNIIFYPNDGKLRGRWGLYRWTPLLVITVSDRFPPDAAQRYAQVICDALNADWVKQKLEQ